MARIMLLLTLITLLSSCAVQRRINAWADKKIPCGAWVLPYPSCDHEGNCFAAVKKQCAMDKEEPKSK